MNESSEIDLSTNNLSSILDSFYTGSNPSNTSAETSSEATSDLNLEKLIQLNEQEELKQINYNDKIMSNLSNNFDIFYSIKSLLSEVNEELKSCVGSISSTKNLISSIEQDKEKIDDSLKEEKRLFEARCKETIYLEKIYEIEKLEQIVSLGISVDSFNYLIKMFEEAYSNLEFIKYYSEVSNSTSSFISTGINSDIKNATNKSTNNNNNNNNDDRVKQYKVSIKSIQYSFNTIKDKVCELITKERWRSDKQAELLIHTSLQLLGLHYTKKLIITNCVDFLLSFFNDLFKTFKDNVSTYSTDIKQTTVVSFTESIFTFSTLKNINICYKPFNILTKLMEKNKEAYNTDGDDDTSFNNEFVYSEHCSIDTVTDSNNINREDILNEICVFYSNCINHLNVNIFKTSPLIIFKQFIDVSKNMSKEIGLSERTTLVEFASLVQLTIKNCIKSVITSWNIEVNVNADYFLKMDLFDLKEKLKAEMFQNIVFLNNMIKDCTEAFEISGLDDLIFSYIDNYIKDFIEHVFKEWAELNGREEFNTVTKQNYMDFTIKNNKNVESDEGITKLVSGGIGELGSFKHFINKVYIEEIIYYNVVEFHSLFKTNTEYYNDGLKRIQNEIYNEVEKYNVIEYFMLAMFIVRSMYEGKDVHIGYNVLAKYIFKQKTTSNQKCKQYNYIRDDDKEGIVKLDCKHEYDKCINVIKLLNYILKYCNCSGQNDNIEKGVIDKEKKYAEILQVFDDDFLEKCHDSLEREIHITLDTFYTNN